MDRHARTPTLRVEKEERRRRLRCGGRFLRPGAPARLRDSRIVARSLRSASAVAARVPLPSLPPPSSPAAAAAEQQQQQQQGGVPHFLWAPESGLHGGARYPLRRRMVAARGVVFSPPPVASQSHGGVLS